MRFFHNLEIFKFFLRNGPNCDTRYVVSNAKKVALTPEMWCRPEYSMNVTKFQTWSGRKLGSQKCIFVCSILFLMCHNPRTSPNDVLYSFPTYKHSMNVSKFKTWSGWKWVFQKRFLYVQSYFYCVITL